MTPKFSLIIRWSDEDQCYIAWSPEFGVGVSTHGSTYEEAARAGREVIESMIDLHKAEHMSLPKAWVYSEPEADQVLGRQLLPGNPAYQEPTKTRKAAMKHAST